MNKKSIERGYMYAKREYEKTGKIIENEDFSKDFAYGINLFAQEVKNNLK